MALPVEMRCPNCRADIAQCGFFVYSTALQYYKRTREFFAPGDRVDEPTGAHCILCHEPLPWEVDELVKADFGRPAA